MIESCLKNYIIGMLDYSIPTLHQNKTVASGGVDISIIISIC